MATLEEIVVQLTAETSELRSELNNAVKVVSQSTEKMSKSIDDFSKGSEKSTSFATTAFATFSGFLASQAVMGAFGLLKDAAGALASELIDAGKEAMAEEQAFTRLANSLKLSGNYSKEAVNGLADFANEMEGLAGVGADVIANNISLLSSLTRLSSEGLQVATKAAIDLAAATGKDLGTATEMIAKAVNGNDMAFKKLGITMNLTSDSASNLEKVAATMQERFGGSAQAKMATFSGSLFVIKDAWGDMFKEVAKAITQNEVVISIMDSLSNVFKDMGKYLSENGSLIRDQLGGALISILGTVESVLAGFNIFFKYLTMQFNLALLPIRNLIDAVQLLGNVLSLDFKGAGKNIEEIGKNFTDVADSFDNNAIDTVVGKIGDLKTAASTAFDGMVGKPIVVAKELEVAGGAIEKVSTLTKEQQELLKSFATGLASQAMGISNAYDFSTAMMQETNAQQMAMLQEDNAAKIQVQTEFFALQQQLRDDQFLKEQDALTTARANNLVTEEQYQAAKLALNEKYALDNAKQQTAMTQFNVQNDKTRKENFKSTMDSIASLSQSGNKELAAIGKAAAITNATIDGYAAVQKALASAPPPFNFALAALVGVATAANVAKIAGVGLKGGIDSVPMSASGGNSGDNFPAVLQAGERVVPKKTNQDLQEFLSQENQGGKNISITVNIAPNTGMNHEQIGGLVEQLNNYFVGGGMKLIGAT